MVREILSPGRAKLVELQGAVERLEDLMRRYTQRRDARNGQRHTLAEDIRMAALEALLPEELERHCQLQRSRLDTYQKLREETVLYVEATGYVASWCKFRRLERTEMILLMLKVRSSQDNRTRKRFKVSVGIAGKQVINRRIAGKGHSSNRTKDKQILLERETTRKASLA